MMHVTTNQYYTNVSECDDSIQIDTGKICKRIERSEKSPTMLELSNFPPREQPKICTANLAVLTLLGIFETLL